MKHTSLATLSLMAVLTAACTIATTGPRLSEYPSAFGPEGATVRVEVPTVTYDGELLETRADGILILSRGRTGASDAALTAETVVRLVPFNRIESVRFQRGTKTDGKAWRKADPGEREQFRLLSRFPQGLTPELLQQLLKMYGQTAPAGGKP